MSDVSGGMRIPPTAGSPTGPSGTPGQVINPPPSALQLVSGDSLGGTVAGTDKLGHLLIKTELGQLSLLTSAKLPIGTQVSLQIRQTGSELYVLIFPSSKKAKDLPARATGGDIASTKANTPATIGTGGGAAAAAGQSSSALRQDTMTLGQKISATLQALPHKGGNQQQVDPLQPRPAGTIPTASSPLAAYSSPGSTAPLPTSGGLTAGSALSLQVLSVQAPLSQSPAPSTMATSGQAATNNATLPPPEKISANLVRFEGLIIGQNGQGRPLLQSPLGLMVLNLKSDLPVGSRLVLESETASVSAKQPVSAPSGENKLNPPKGWAALDDVVTSLTSSGQSFAGHEILNKLPKADAKLTSSLLFFMNALKSGDLASWFPPLNQFQLKQQGKDDLALKLGQDFSQLSQLSGEPATPTDWRLFLLPFMDDSQLREIRLFLRQGGQGGDGQHPDEHGQEATRFVVDVDLTRLGSMQLDGLVRESRFDLMLRSRHELPLLMRNDISQIFESANEIAGFQGSLTFQNSSDWQQMKIPGESSTVGNLVV